jgi:heptosyltransferase-3
LRLAYPQAIINVLTYKSNLGILLNNQDINEIITISNYPTKLEYFKLFKQIFHKYDLSIATQSGDRPLIYTILAGKKRLAILDKSYRWKYWFTHAQIESNNNTHTIIQNVKLAKLLNIPVSYKVIIPKKNINKIIINQSYAVIHMLPMYNYKRWHLNGWIELTNYLTYNKKLTVVFTGGTAKNELAYIENALLKMPKTAINLAGKLNFTELAQLIKKADVYIGTDTVVTHLAAATGTKTIALFGPTNPIKWAPFPYNYTKNINPFKSKGVQTVNNVTLIQKNMSCVPCHKEGCKQHLNSYSDCLQKLSAEFIINFL